LYKSDLVAPDFVAQTLYCVLCSNAVNLMQQRNCSFVPNMSIK